VLAGLLCNRPGEEGTAKLTEALSQAVREAHTTVSLIAADEEECKGMGSTAAVALIRDGRVVISHVGDCRVYHQRGAALTQVTRDHTLVARMIELGKITPEEAVGHPASNQVTQALGKQAPIQPSQHELELERGDWLILACDGLTAHVAEDVLRASARQAAPSAAFLAKRLVELANEGGGTDNCTVVAAYCY
jgi:protein phosphatase